MKQFSLLQKLAITGIAGVIGVIGFQSSASAKIKVTLGDAKNASDQNPKEFTFKLDFGRDIGGNPIESDPITIPVNSSNNLCTGKRDSLFDAVKDGVTVNGVNRLVMPVKVGACMLKFNSPFVKSFIVTGDTTGQKFQLEAVDGQKAKEGKIDGKFIELATNLSGIDEDGDESIFTASLGFETDLENVFASSSFLFSDLGGNDIDDWLSTIFGDLQGQLPTIYQPNLSLDLISDEITFDFPIEDMLAGGLISNETTDTNASLSLSIEAESVPEPSTILGLLTIGCLGLGLKRKKQS